MYKKIFISLFLTIFSVCKPSLINPLINATEADKVNQLDQKLTSYIDSLESINQALKTALQNPNPETSKMLQSYDKQYKDLHELCKITGGKLKEYGLGSEKSPFTLEEINEAVRNIDQDFQALEDTGALPLSYTINLGKEKLANQTVYLAELEQAHEKISTEKRKEEEKIRELKKEEKKIQDFDESLAKKSSEELRQIEAGIIAQNSDGRHNAFLAKIRNFLKNRGNF